MYQSETLQKKYIHCTARQLTRLRPSSAVLRNHIIIQLIQFQLIWISNQLKPDSKCFNLSRMSLLLLILVHYDKIGHLRHKTWNDELAPIIRVTWFFQKKTKKKMSITRKCFWKNVTAAVYFKDNPVDKTNKKVPQTFLQTFSYFCTFC